MNEKCAGKGVKVNPNITVLTGKSTKQLYPVNSVIGPDNMIVMGEELQTRTCILRGVVRTHVSFVTFNVL